MRAAKSVPSESVPYRCKFVQDLCDKAEGYMQIQHATIETRRNNAGAKQLQLRNSNETEKKQD
jgi:hypothetical protein